MAIEQFNEALFQAASGKNPEDLDPLFLQENSIITLPDGTELEGRKLGQFVGKGSADSLLNYLNDTFPGKNEKGLNHIIIRASDDPEHRIYGISYTKDGFVADQHLDEPIANERDLEERFPAPDLIGINPPKAPGLFDRISHVFRSLRIFGGKGNPVVNEYREYQNKVNEYKTTMVPDYKTRKGFEQVKQPQILRSEKASPAESFEAYTAKAATRGMKARQSEQTIAVNTSSVDEPGKLIDTLEEKLGKEVVTEKLKENILAFHREYQDSVQSLEKKCQENGSSEKVFDASREIVGIVKYTELKKSIESGTFDKEKATFYSLPKVNENCERMVRSDNNLRYAVEHGHNAQFYQNRILHSEELGKMSDGYRNLIEKTTSSPFKNITPETRMKMINDIRMRHHMAPLPVNQAQNNQPVNPQIQIPQGPTPGGR